MVNLVFDDSKAKRKGGEKRERESSRDESTINEERGGIDASGETRNVNASSCNASSVIRDNYANSFSASRCDRCNFPCRG